MESELSSKYEKWLGKMFMYHLIDSGCLRLLWTVSPALTMQSPVQSNEMNSAQMSWNKITLGKFGERTQYVLCWWLGMQIGVVLCLSECTDPKWKKGYCQIL